jgi:hypothetical protein
MRPGGGSLLKVIGAGFGRTGTLSLKAALEELGFGPCYHMTELFDKPDHIRFWDEAADEVARGETVGWEEVFSGYEATVDWPACIFYEELMEAYPDAKVLLSVRDPERWYDSAESTIARMPNSGAFSPQALLIKATGLLVPSMRRAPSMAEKIISEGTLDGRFDDREHAVEVFERHNKEVKRRVPAEKLLVFEVREGWGPLCEFLGVEVPDKPFPHLNDGEEFPRMMRRQIATVLAPALGRALVALSAVLAALLMLRMILPRSKRDR